jgi:hypothetical protein
VKNAYFLMNTVHHLLDDVSENMCSESKGTSGDSVVHDLPLHIPSFSDVRQKAAYNTESRKGLLHLHFISSSSSLVFSPKAGFGRNHIHFKKIHALSNNDRI